jgi:lipooligosaccharide transport system ATP-binding protein
MQCIIEAENLTKRFGDITAVDGISFQVAAGECFGLLGPNGAGKTTTIRMIYGFSPMTSGTLRVFGLDTVHDLRQIKYRIGVCQQENSLDPDLTVLQNLEVFARYFDMPRKRRQQRARELLRFIALENRRNAAVNELSGGLMRRLVLARSLVNRPELLILDEPTTGLDPQSRHLFWERLALLKAQGITTLLTTHYMEEASRLCDRLIIIDHGRIIARGAPAGLIAEHIGDHVIEIADAAEQVQQYVTSQGFSCEQADGRLIIYGSGLENLCHSIISSFSATSCGLRRATLEDVFLKLTGRDLRE